jgi:beta-lactamase superfamily II metal-dependent hydrolase
VPALLDRFAVGAVWLPRGSARDPAFAAIRAAAARRRVPVVERGLRDGSERVGDLRVEFLWPPDDAAVASRNDRSLVLRVTVDGGAAVLLPGDVGVASERALLARGASLAADVLLLPHHGSRTSTGAPFLAAVSPRLAVVSAPCRGRFPLPAPEVRRRVADAGIPLRWTGRDGATIVGLSPRIDARGLGPPRTDCRVPARGGRMRRGFP